MQHENKKKKMTLKFESLEKALIFFPLIIHKDHYYKIKLFFSSQKKKRLDAFFIYYETREGENINSKVL